LDKDERICTIRVSYGHYNYGKNQKKEGKTAFLESGQAVSMTLALEKKDDFVIAQSGLLLKVMPKREAGKN